MPRYFFNVRAEHHTVDEEGQELADVGAARECALEAAREMVCFDIKQGRLYLEHMIDVFDDRGEALFTITFRDAFDVNG